MRDDGIEGDECASTTTANTSGIRNAPIANNAVITNATASATGITIEQAMIQWAGFTFGVAPENYAFMPSIFYTGNNWAGFPNGMKQLAYTATFGGGFSATLALEDRTDFGYAAATGRLDAAALVFYAGTFLWTDRKSTRLNSSHT